jgi:hypothetical protein
MVCSTDSVGDGPILDQIVWKRILPLEIPGEPAIIPIGGFVSFGPVADI